MFFDGAYRKNTLEMRQNPIKIQKKAKICVKTFDKERRVGYNCVAMMNYSAYFGHGLMSEIAAVKLANAADNSDGQVRKNPRGAANVVKSSKALLISPENDTHDQVVANAIGG